MWQYHLIRSGSYSIAHHFEKRLYFWVIDWLLFCSRLRAVLRPWYLNESSLGMTTYSIYAILMRRFSLIMRYHVLCLDSDSLLQKDSWIAKNAWEGSIASLLCLCLGKVRVNCSWQPQFSRLFSCFQFCGHILYGFVGSTEGEHILGFHQTAIVL